MKRSTSKTHRAGFTLIELGAVVAILGLITAFIAAVGFQSVEQARIRATQGLITKLEAAINERLAALMDVSITPNGAHRYLASIQVPAALSSALPWGLVSDQRAFVIAQMDYLKREMPDVFFIQGDITTPYPVNFAGLPYPSGSTNTLAYVLPLGNRAGPGFNEADPKATYAPNDLDPDGDGNPNIGPGAFAGVSAGSFGYPTTTNQTAYGGVADAGIYGASYSARSALNELIGYNAIGTDSVDNNGNGLIDEITEGTNGGSDKQAIANITKFLTNHAHVTARSETLYAMLVHGSGPLGNLFRPDDFTDNEVQDTDGDGLPEFVDGWGSPLQFYRWPIYYPGGSMTVTVNTSGGYVYEFSGQRGSAPYQFTSEQREMFPFDQNKLLVAPAWFGTNMGASATPSAKAGYVMGYFTSFVDPNVGATGAGALNYWDMTGYYPRAEFSSKFLVLSAGPDEQYGVNMITDATIAANISSPSTTSKLILGVPSTTPANVIVGENWAAYTNGFPSQAALSAKILAPPDEATDNITNLNFQTDEGGVK